MQGLCEAGVANRPHIKTHKSPVIATMQRDAGARGITCQKIGEAEVMVEAGLDDILISYNILGEQKLGRLGALLSRGEGHGCGRQSDGGRRPSAGRSHRGRGLDVVVECDTGRKRAGVATVAEAVALAKDIARAPLGVCRLCCIRLRTRSPRRRPSSTLRRRAREAGLEPVIVSSGGTPNLRNLGKIKGVTEHRAAPACSTIG